MKTNEIKTKTLPSNTPTPKKESNTWVYITVGVLIGIIVLIYLFGIKGAVPLEPITEGICISQISQLYVSTGCSYCENQKQILGEDIELFDVIDCRFTPELCGDINVVPTWIIKGVKYEGLMSAEKLKELTEC